MLNKNKLKKIVSLMVSICLLIQMTIIPVLAEDTQSKITTTVTIEDLKTGEVETFEAGNSRVINEVDNQGRSVKTVIADVGDNQISTRAGQSGTNTFSGWKGTVSISFTDNGTYAKLTKATGNWTRKSGSASISAMSMNYGQDLMTNARNGRVVLNSNSTHSVTPSWPAGKYAYNVGNKVGATIFATVAGKRCSVACNYGW